MTPDEQSALLAEVERLRTENAGLRADNALHRDDAAALRVATERLRLAAEAGIIGIWDWDVEKDELAWDPSMYRLYGVPEGAFGGAYQAWIRAVHPDDKERVDAEIQAALRGEREYGPEFRVVWPDGSIHHVQAASRTLRDASGRPQRMVGINYDLTERKRAEEAQRRLNRELRALGRANEALLRATDERSLLEQVCRIVCEEAGYQVAWVGYAEHDEARTVRPVGWAGIEEAVLIGVRSSWADNARGRGPMGTAIRTGRIAYMPRIEAVLPGAPWQTESLRMGLCSAVGLPLRDREGATFGALGIFSSDPAPFTPDEQRLLEELAGDLAFGITVLRAREELARAERERLEHLRFLECMDRVNRAIVRGGDLRQMASDVLEVVRSVLGCDRAFLVHPCDPQAPAWRVRMERHRPEWPGAPIDADLPMDRIVSEKMRMLLAAGGPLRFDEAHVTAVGMRERWGVRSYMSMALRPRQGPPWELGVHQCSGQRTWTAEEERILQEVGRRLEDALATQLVYEELRESEAKLAKAERIVHVGYWDRDLVANRIQLSDEAYRIFGIDPERPVTDLGKWNTWWQGLLHPEDRARVQEVFARALDGRGGYDVEYRIVRPGGEVRHIHSQADVTRDEAGRALRFLGTMQDVTDRKRAEHEIRELNQGLEARVAERTAELAAANRELEAFAYSVSHDLRAPLRAIDGFRGLLQSRIAPHLDEPAARYLQNISEAANRMGRLVDDLLAFSRMGRLELARHRVELDTVVKEVVQELGDQAAGREVEWRIGPLPVVYGDPAMLRLVLVNLLSNALKFTRTRPQARIEVAASRGAGATVISVRDNGVGFDMAHAEKLFGVFQRLHRAEEFEGTGIGLASVRRIVLRHGGEAWAEGRPGEGATFHFSLPD
jgi:PAS domain S-box-containing protein